MAEDNKKTNNDDEPSIEEILNSIRKIISDEGEKEDEFVDDKLKAEVDLTQAVDTDKMTRDRVSPTLDISQGFDNGDHETYKSDLDLSSTDKEDGMSADRVTPEVDLAQMGADGMSADRVNPEIDLAQMGTDGMSADRVNPEIDLAQMGADGMSADRVNPEIDLAQMGADGMSADRVTPEVNLARGDDDFVKDNGGDDLVLTGEEDEGIVISDLDLSQTEEGDDILDLTDDMVVEEGEKVSKTEEEIEEIVDFETDTDDTVKEDEETLNNDVGMSMDDIRQGISEKIGDESLLSDKTASFVSAELDKLVSVNLAIEREKEGRVGKVTLEDIVFDILKPIIKEWLDKNLPALIEKVVAKEVEKITKRTNRE